MQTKLENIDSQLFEELDEQQSGALIGGDAKPTGTASATYSNGSFDGSVDADFSL